MNGSKPVGVIDTHIASEPLEGTKKLASRSLFTRGDREIDAYDRERFASGLIFRQRTRITSAWFDTTLEVWNDVTVVGRDFESVLGHHATGAEGR